MTGRQVALVVFFMFGGLALPAAAAQQGATGGEWRSHGGDAGSTKYTPLDQITSENFSSLELAWHWRTVDTHLVQVSESGASLVPAEQLFARLEAEDPDRWRRRPRITRLAATPLMVNGLLYLSTPLYRAAAIDATTGKTRWVYDPRAYESGTPAVVPWNHRGVAYWENSGEARVVWATGDGYLVAVDAKTGLPATDFGRGAR